MTLVELRPPPPRKTRRRLNLRRRRGSTLSSPVNDEGNQMVLKSLHALGRNVGLLPLND